MIVGGYELHLYCDHPECKASGTFAGPSAFMAWHEARRSGWFTPGDQKVLCKTHKPNKRNKK